MEARKKDEITIEHTGVDGDTTKLDKKHGTIYKVWWKGVMILFRTGKYYQPQQTSELSGMQVVEKSELG